MFPTVFASSQFVHIRIALALFSLLILVVTFESIRRTELKERYALLWIFPCLLLLLLTVFPQILDWAKDVFGMTYASSMTVVVFVSLLTAVFHLSLAISKSERKLAKIAQRCASLEARIKELENGTRKQP